MPDKPIIKISIEELDDLCAKLRNLKLSDAQRALLDAALKIAWETAAPEKALKEEFEGCFEPDQADVIMSYGQGAGVIKPHLIKP